MRSRKTAEEVVWQKRVLTVFVTLFIALVLVGGVLLFISALSIIFTRDGGINPPYDETGGFSAGQLAGIVDPPASMLPQYDPINEAITDIIASMSLREKVCQMLIVTPDAITGVSGTTVAGSITRSAIEQYPVGGLILFSPNIVNSNQVSTFNSTVQTYSEIPLFISVDEEGGRVTRLMTALQTYYVGAMLNYQNDDDQVAYNNAKTIADALSAHGFNLDFAPVADVWSNSANTVIGDRAYSTDYNTAARLVAAAVRGFRASGIACTLKHFPGHGDTYEDTHDSLAYVSKSLNDLRQNEFKPFVAGIEAGAEMVMIGHIIVQNVDDKPASLSKTLVTDILRGELGFKGVVITDALEMGGIAWNYSSQYIAVTAVNAGVDILLMPPNVDATIAALIEAVESGEIPESRIDESVRRILRLKVDLGLITL